MIRFEAQNYTKVLGGIKEKGEFTLAIKPDKKTIKNDKIGVFDTTRNEPRKIAAILANYLNLKPKEAYDLLVDLKNERKNQ